MPIRRVRLGVLGCPVYFYTAEQVKKLHEKAGFICERIERVGAIYSRCSTSWERLIVERGRLKAENFGTRRRTF